MNADWLEITLGEVATLQRGFDLPQQNRKLGNIPIISSSGKTDTHNEARVTAPGVVTGRYGTIGQVFFIEEDFFPLNTTLWVKDFHGNEPHFVYYLLKTLDFQQFNDKSSVPGINRNHVHLYKVYLPPLETQKKIAFILGALDDKIELNRRTNATLEAMAQTLFKSWFVNFDVVRAKALGLEPKGVDAATAALFPSAFVSSSMGEIPEGWEVGTLEKFITLSKATLTPQAFPDELFDHFSLPAFDAGQIPMQDLGVSILSNKFMVQSDSILVSKLNPETPRVWLTVIHPERRAIASTEFLVVMPRDLQVKFFVHGILNSDFFTGIFASKVTGTSKSHQRARPNDVLQAEIIVPSPEIAFRFSEAVQPLYEKSLENRLESVRLSTTRDSLLPKLLSGELDVGNLV